MALGSCAMFSLTCCNQGETDEKVIELNAESGEIVEPYKATAVLPPPESKQVQEVAEIPQNQTPRNAYQEYEAPVVVEEEVKVPVASEGIAKFTEEEPPKRDSEGEQQLKVSASQKTAPVSEATAQTGDSEKVKIAESMYVQRPSEEEKGASPFQLENSHAQEPMPAFASILCVFSIVVPNAALVIGFSAMAYGLEVFSALSHSDYTWFYGNILLGGATALAALLGVLDIGRWPKVLSIPTAIIAIAIFYAGAVMKGRDYPWAPMLLTLFFTPVFLGLIRMLLCYRVRRNAFYGLVSAIFSFVALIIVAVWVYYIFIPPHKWNQETKNSLVSDSMDIYKEVFEDRALNYCANGNKLFANAACDCGPDQDEDFLDTLGTDKKTEIKTACTTAATLWWLSWTCPGIAAACNIVAGAFCLMTGVVGKVDSMSSIQRNLTRFVLMIAFLLTGMYATATMSATSLHLGSTLMAFFGAGLCIIGAWMFMELDHNLLAEVAKHSKLMHQLVAIANSDWTKGLGFAFMVGPGLIFFSLNYSLNACRKCRGAAGDAASDYFTPAGRKLYNTVSVWDWSSILVKCCLLMELFFTLQVGVSKATYVFLSFLNTELEETSISMVCVIVFGVGASMFLLPPVPGLPVYVFAGILIGEKGRQDSSIGFAGAVLIATAVSLFTKLCACVGQYMIGYFLGKSLKVQQLIGVDKVPTRAIEMVLKSRGLNPGKVSVLVGGPDWPTSVTCGILRLNIPQMLLGTLPVVSLLTPCVLAGACMGRTKPGEESDYSMLANAFTAAAALVNMASMAYAVYTVSHIVNIYGEELAKPRPEHAAIAELTRQEQAAVDNYRRTVQWNGLGFISKAVLLIAAFSMIACNGAFIGLSELCFETFAVSSKISDPFDKDGLENNALNIIIWPLGWICLMVFALGLILHILWVYTMGSLAKTAMKGSAP